MPSTRPISTPKVTGSSSPHLRRQVEGFFHDMRLDPTGRPREGVTLNNPAYKGAKIIVANTNFACGSSRENAVTTMVDNGFRAIIAPSFGDIFFNNCFQNGCLAIRLPADRVARMRVILHELPGVEIAIDLAKQTVVGPDGKTDSFEVDSFRKEMLLKGADEVKITLGYDADIKRFEDRQRQEMPWL